MSVVDAFAAGFAMVLCVAFFLVMIIAVWYAGVQDRETARILTETEAGDWVYFLYRQSGTTRYYHRCYVWRVDRQNRRIKLIHDGNSFSVQGSAIADRIETNRPE